MAHTRNWNAAYEAIPADSAAASQGANRIRDLKLDIRERLDLDHIMDEDTVDDGRHRHVCLVEQASDPGNLANKGFIYTKDVSGVTELFYRDDSGDVLQITNDGKMLLLDTNNAFTKGQATTESVITYATTITPDASLSNAFRMVFGSGNTILDPPTNPKSGQVLTIQFKQDSEGSRTLTFGTTIYGNVNDDLVLSTGANKIDMLIMYYDGNASRWRVLNLK
ncbi:MAG: hypothetical protein QQN63_14100, partial [Nitrosopumilus sp.]